MARITDQADDKARLTISRAERKAARAVKVLPDRVDNVYAVMSLLDAAHVIDESQKKFKLAGATIDSDARRSTVVSTGMLCSDLFLNGGIYPGGWYTFKGPEGSAKSTHAAGVFVSLFYSSVPIVVVYDAEGSMTPEYIEAIARTSNVKRDIDIKKAFGVRDPKDPNKWIVEPRIRYVPESSLERIWKSMAQILRNLPDKMFIDGEWWLLFDNTKENMARFKGQHNTKIGGQYGKIAMPSLDGGLPQAIFMIDSLASMISDADDDEDGDGTNALGLEARGHSKHAKKVKGRLKRKHATIVCTNQIRDKPMAKAWEPPTYEPGGNALKFNSDCRVAQTPRAVPHAGGQLEEEDSVQFRKGSDKYRYICMRTDKNKFGPPFLEMWQRIWITDPKGQPHGLCPVYDTWTYLKLTGQATGAIGGKKGITVTLPAEPEGSINDIELTLTKLTWLDFKALILLTGTELRDFCTELGLDFNPRIRERCFNQIREDGVDRYFQVMHGLDDAAEDDVIPYDSMTDVELRNDVKKRKLADSKAVRKLDRDACIELLETDDMGAEKDEDE